MIIAVSQLIDRNVIISDSRFTESLSIISSYASNDKAVQVASCSGNTVFSFSVFLIYIYYTVGSYYSASR